MLKVAPALWDVSCRNIGTDLKYDEISKMAWHFKINVREISRQMKFSKIPTVAGNRRKQREKISVTDNFRR